MQLAVSDDRQNDHFMSSLLFSSMMTMEIQRENSMHRVFSYIKCQLYNCLLEPIMQQLSVKTQLIGHL
jgi:hypothetical protein